MGLANTCRVCLCGSRRLLTVSDTLVQEIWAKLTNAKFNTNDGKSLLVCYMCCAHLRRSHQLMKRALEAEKLLTDIVNNGSEQSQNELLLLAKQSFAFDYKYAIEHQYPLEYKQSVRNTVEEIKKENEGGSEEDNNVQWSVINIKVEVEEMGLADTCRVCLCGNKRLHTISDTLFQEIWEKLTNAKFNTNDGKSLLVCYICCAQLRRAYQLMKRALEAEKLLTAIVNNGSEQSQNVLLLLAKQSFAFDYKYAIEHQYPLEYKQPVRNIVKEIKIENVGGIDEDNNVECSVINIKVEKEDSSQEDNLDNADGEWDTRSYDDTPLKQEEDNLDNADVKSDIPSDDDTPLKQEDNLDNADVELDTPSDDGRLVKQILEREGRLVLERTDIGASARKRTLNEVPHNAKRIKVDETTNDENPLTTSSALLKSLPNSNCKQSYKSFSKNSSEDLYVILPKNEVQQVEDVITQGSEALTSKVVCNNDENETIQQCLLKSAYAVAPSTSLNKHITGEKPYICYLCDYRFSFRSNLEMHVKYKHTKEKNFSCHVCQYKCVTQSELNRHIKKHTGEKPYKCDFCDYRCSHKGGLESHTKYKHTKEMNFSCQVCDFKCISKSYLAVHLRKHTGEKPFMCDFCDYRCSVKSHLESHMKFKHTKEKNFSCQVCQYKCVTKSELKRHIKQHTGEKPYICDFCDYRCSVKSHLESHKKFKHTKEKNFSCHECEYKCVTKSELNIHIQKHTGEKPHLCGFCDYRSSVKRDLESHIKFKHTKEKNFSCQLCQYKCITKSELNRHIQKHTGEKPYKCDFCDYRCSLKGGLDSHIKFKHTKEKNFSCHVCEYKCITKSDLNKHIRKHTGEKP